MTGYVFGPKLGAAAYNLSHTYVTVGAVWLIGHWFRIPSVAPHCHACVARIGFDRLLGFGLNYPNAFKDTHLANI